MFEETSPYLSLLYFQSVQFSCSVVSDSLWPHGLQHARLPCPSLSPDFAQTHVHWVDNAVQPSHPLLPPTPPVLNLCPASGSFLMSQLFSSGGQNIVASASVLPMNIQDWFPLELTGLILKSKGLWRVFSNTIIRKHQFFSTQPYLWSNSHICTWLLEKP